MMSQTNLTLEQQRISFSRRKLQSTPLSGMIAWFIVGVVSLFLPDQTTALILFIATGSIVYISMGISKLTGEDILANRKENNPFDRLFFITVAQSLLAYAFAIPFFLLDYTSLPMTIGILTGTMWLPLSWIINHWVGYFHAIVRTVLIVVLWYGWPEDRFTVIPFGIVLVYLITLVILNKRKLPEAG